LLKLLSINSFFSFFCTHTNIVKYLISKGSLVNLRDKDNVTALMEASVGGHLPVVEHLVKNNAEVDAVAASGEITIKI
jgi:ankyrin repeat protein